MSGTVDANTVGTYAVSYSVTDITGSTATAQAAFTVKDTVPPEITMNQIFIDELAEFNGDAALQLAAASDKSGVKSFTATVETKSPWSFAVTYTATDNNGLSQTLRQTVERSHYGELKGVADRTVTSQEMVTDVSHIQGTDKGQAAAVKATIESSEGNRYTVRYEVLETKAVQTAVITLEEKEESSDSDSEGAKDNSTGGPQGEPNSSDSTE